MRSLLLVLILVAPRAADADKASRCKAALDRAIAEARSSNPRSQYHSVMLLAAPEVPGYCFYQLSFTTLVRLRSNGVTREDGKPLEAPEKDLGRVFRTLAILDTTNKHSAMTLASIASFFVQSSGSRHAIVEEVLSTPPRYQPVLARADGSVKLTFHRTAYSGPPAGWSKVMAYGAVRYQISVGPGYVVKILVVPPPSLRRR